MALTANQADVSGSSWRGRSSNDANKARPDKGSFSAAFQRAGDIVAKGSQISGVNCCKPGATAASLAPAAFSKVVCSRQLSRLALIKSGGIE